jgi:hypothetical protein
LIQYRIKLLEMTDEQEAENDQISDATLLIRPEDFRSIRLTISMTNSTTRTQIRNGQRFFGGENQTVDYGSEDLTIRLVEFLEKGMVLEVPSKSCSQGHILVLEIQAEGPGVSDEFKGPVKVHTLDDLPDGKLRVGVDLMKHDPAQWKRFMSIYDRRQEEVTELFEQLKGLE